LAAQRSVGIRCRTSQLASRGSLHAGSAMSRVAVRQPPAVLFDVDGTLVASNYLHFHAWCQAFYEAGLAVETWRLHRSIGMDGAKLARTLSRDAPDHVQTGQKTKRTARPPLSRNRAPARAATGAQQLLRRVAARTGHNRIAAQPVSGRRAAWPQRHQVAKHSFRLRAVLRRVSHQATSRVIWIRFTRRPYRVLSRRR
jgi:beta-phosphoglucomutase-like phosphatase (HAD superfamily)